MADPIHILVVDDDVNVRKSLVRYLEDEGFVIQSAESAEDALEILRNEAFEVAIVDIRLPKIDGNTLMLEAHRIQPDLRFIVHTGSVDYEIPRAVRDLGFCPGDVFQKPVKDMAVFTDAIHCKMQKENCHDE